MSVLFADLVGFTTFAEERDPEATREMLSRYFATARNVVERYGGTLEKFIGDAVMAVWGAPIGHEDDAERAVLAALDIVAATPIATPGLAARAAVMTGEAAVTIGARGEGLVAGDLVNTAARLQALAPPGRVLVGGGTRRAAERRIRFEPGGAHEVKGRNGRVDAWLVHGPAGDSAPPEPELVGRRDELRLLHDLLAATIRERRARLVSVVGAAGIGKTRLAGQFTEELAVAPGGARVLSGRSPAYGEGITFWALGEVVRRSAGLAESDDAEATRDAIRRLVSAATGDDDEAARLSAALLALLGVSPAGGDPRLLFSAWRTFLERLAAQRPLVVVLEDLHWADAGMLDFVEELVDWARTSPMMVLTLSRADLLDRRPDWGARRRSFTSIVLEPLDDEAMGHFVQQLLPGRPPREMAAIVARAEGIPLYATELVRAGADKGAATGRAMIPDTLNALIAARLDGLLAEERELLLVASVLGQTFTAQALASIARRPADWVLKRLDALVGRGILTPSLDPESPERGQHAFVQALVREVAYATLARRDRVALHLAAAADLASIVGDEVAPVRAGHYLAALRGSAPQELSASVRAQAQVALRAAGERALALGSPEQAAAFLARGAELADDPSDRASLAEAVGRAASAAGRPDEAVSEFESAATIWTKLRERPRALRALALSGRALLDAYRIEDARRSLDAAAAAFADLGDDGAMTFLDAQRTRVAFLLDEDAEAIRLADAVLARGSGGVDEETRADMLVTKGSAMVALGRSTEGLALLEEAGALARAVGSIRVELRALANRAIYVDHRDTREALRLAREALELAAQRGDRSTTANLLHTAAWNARRTGDWSWAAEALEALLETGLTSSDRVMALSAALQIAAAQGRTVSTWMAEIEAVAADRNDRFGGRAVSVARASMAFAAGDLPSARRAWHVVVERNPAFAPIGLEDAARAALWMGDTAGARDDLRRLESNTVEPPLLTGIATTLRAGIAALEGRTQDALNDYRAALGVWREMGLPWGEAMAGLDMATLLEPSQPDVAAAIERAREILVGLDAGPFLDRLEAAAERVSAGRARPRGSPRSARRRGRPRGAGPPRAP